MSDIAERVKKIVVEHLGVEARQGDRGRKLHRRPRRRQSRHRRTGDGVRGRVRLRDSGRCGRNDPHRRRCREVPRKERKELTLPCTTSDRGLHGHVGRPVGAVRIRMFACRSPVCDVRLRARASGRHGKGAGMRRVVVTGLGMVTPLGCGVEATWKRLLAGESGARRIEKFEVADLPAQDRLPDSARRRLRTAPTIPTNGWSRRSSARSTSSSSSRCARRARRSSDSGWKPTSYEDQITTGVMIGSGIGGIEGIAETALVLEGARSAPRVAVLHSRPHHQSRVRLRVDRVRPEGAESCGRHRLLDRRARDRRRRRG